VTVKGGWQRDGRAKLSGEGDVEFKRPYMHQGLGGFAATAPLAAASTLRLEHARDKLTAGCQHKPAEEKRKRWILGLGTGRDGERMGISQNLVEEKQK